VVPLPAISLLATAGIYVTNDLADVKNDRANNKKRPISSGVVSRRDGVIFVVIVNATACLLAVVTQSLVTLIILGGLIALGPLYSAPRIGLKDRFVLKTLSISAGMILCLMLGASSDYFGSGARQSWSMAWYGASIVGMMIFVTSPYNDLGDARGDRESGRRTIPIVLGYDNTLYLISAFATAIFACALTMYFLGFIGWPAPLCQGAVTIFMIFTAFSTINRNGDEAFIRKRHSRMVPLHLLVHAGIILGILLA
jgi:4-hydroxybenzoate polyprenyltransferase